MCSINRAQPWSSKENSSELFSQAVPAKVRCIIDCFEYFTETPSGLDIAATMWSEYKHYAIKVLVAITPTGMVEYHVYPLLIYC